MRKKAEKSDKLVLKKEAIRFLGRTLKSVAGGQDIQIQVSCNGCFGCTETGCTNSPCISY